MLEKDWLWDGKEGNGDLGNSRVRVASRLYVGVIKGE